METGPSRHSWKIANLNSQLRTAIMVCLVATLSYLVAKVGGALKSPQADWPLWPGNVLLVSVLLLVPRRKWPILMAAAFAAYVLFDLQAGVTPRSTALLILSDTVEVLTAALCLSYFFDGVPRLDSVKSLAKYSFFAVILAPFTGAFVGALATNGNYWTSWRISFLSEALGFLTLMPALLGWIGKGTEWGQKSRSYYLEAAALIVTLVITGYLIFVAPERSVSPALIYSLVPFLLWSALRFRSTGVSTSVFIIAFLSIWGVTHGRGPFTGSGQLNNVLPLQLFLFFTAAPFMVLAVLVEEREKAAGALRESDARERARVKELEALLDAAPITILIAADAKCKSITANRTGSQLHGVPIGANFSSSASTIEPHPFRIMRDGVEIPPEELPLQRAAASGIPVFGEISTVVLEDGTEHHMIGNAAPLFGEDGKPRGAVGAFVDITERKEVERSLRESEERFRLAARAGKMFAYEWDAATDVIVRSAESSQILGIDETTHMTGQQVLAKVHPEDREKLIAAVAELRPEKPRLEISYRMVRPDDTVIWVERTSSAQFDEQGKMLRIIGMVSDITERKRAEQELRESEEKFRSVFRDAGVGMTIVSPEGRFLACNEAFSEFIGYTEEELLHKTVQSVTYPEDWPAFSQRLIQAITDGASFQRVEKRCLHKNGQVLCAECSASVIRNSDGKPQYFVAEVLDVTERRRAEQSLRESEERLRLAQEVGNIGVYEWDIQKNTNYWSRELERIYGLKPGSFGGTIEAWIELVHPEDRERLIGAARQHVQDKRQTDSEFRIIWPCGEVRWIFSRGYVFRDPTGRPLRMLGINIDITARKRTEAILRESEERFRSVANSAPVLIWMSGTDKMCTFFNKAWLEFTGRSMEQELGEGWASGVHSDDLKRCLGIYTAAFDARVDFEMEYRLRRFDGKYRWIVDYGVPRFESNGTFLGYIGSCVDITERRLSEEALLDMSGRLITAHEEERTRIARELHDDLSQRMALLEIGLEQFEQETPRLSPKARQQLHKIAEVATEVSSDIHDMSHQLHPSKLDTLGLTAAVGGFCRELTKQHGLQIEFVHHDLPGEIPKDVTLCLFRIVQEALRNVVKHSGGMNAKVELSGFAHDIDLYISDSGRGFDPESVTGSAGLGLISIRERLRLVGGQLSVESEPSRGTRISVRVPMRTADAPATDKGKAQAAWS